MLSRRIGDLEGQSASVALFDLAIVLAAGPPMSVNRTASPPSPHATLRVVTGLLHRNEVGEHLCEKTNIYVNSLDVIQAQQLCVRTSDIRELLSTNTSTTIYCFS